MALAKRSAGPSPLASIGKKAVKKKLAKKVVKAEAAGARKVKQAAPKPRGQSGMRPSGRAFVRPDDDNVGLVVTLSVPSDIGFAIGAVRQAGVPIAAARPGELHLAAGSTEVSKVIASLRKVGFK